jgi:cytochrome c-type biogenesis protein
MNKYASILIVLALFLIGIAALIVIIPQNTPENDTNNPKLSRLEEIDQLNLSAESGEQYELDKIKNKVVLVNSWATWCSFCTAEMKDFAKAQSEYPDDLVIIAINRAESKDETDVFFEVSGIEKDSLLFLTDPEDSFYDYLNGIGMPETLVLDRDGNEIDHIVGPIRYEDILKYINQL